MLTFSIGKGAFFPVRRHDDVSQDPAVLSAEPSDLLPEIEFVYIPETGPRFQQAPTAGGRSIQADEAIAPVEEQKDTSAVLTLDGKDAASMQPYIEQLRSKLGRTIRHRAGARVVGRTEAILYFVLDQHGNVKSAKVIGSGSAAGTPLEKAVLEGIQASAPFPPLPASWLKETVSFTVRIRFQES